MIADPLNVIFVSAASAWEIATKVRLGKLPGVERLERDFLEVIENSGYTLVSIDDVTALRAGRLVADHGDPFDRIIASTALAMDIPVLSTDKKLDISAFAGYGKPRAINQPTAETPGAWTDSSPPADIAHPP